MPSTSLALQAAHWSARFSCGRAGVSISGFTWQAICRQRPWGCGPIEFGLVLIGSSWRVGMLPPSLLVVFLARASHFCLSWSLRSGRLDVLAQLCPHANCTSTVPHAGQVLGSTNPGDLATPSPFIFVYKVIYFFSCSDIHIILVFSVSQLKKLL